MEVYRKWYQLINRRLSIIDKNFTEEKIFEYALSVTRTYTSTENSIQGRDNTDIWKRKKEHGMPRKP